MKLKNIPIKHLLATLAVANITFGGLFYYLWTNQDMKVGQEIQRARDTARSGDQVKKTVRDAGGDIDKAIARQQELLTKNSQAVASSVDSLALMKQVGQLAVEAGVKLGQFTMGQTTVTSGGLKKTAITVAVEAPNADTYVRFVSDVQEKVAGARPQITGLPGGGQKITQSIPVFIFSREGVVAP